MLTFTYTTHTDEPKGKTIKADKLLGNMTQAEKDQFEAEAVSVEQSLPNRQYVWTVDSADVGFPPRGKRSEQ